MTAGLSIERLRRDGEVFMQELSREYYLAHAGLKASAELQPIYEKHRGILNRENYHHVRTEKASGWRYNPRAN